MDFDRIQSKLNDAFQELMEEEGVERITDEQAARWPLDTRARPQRMYTNGEVLCVPSNYIRMLDYYGGFEYVGAEHRMQVGEWVIFSNEDSRVAQVIDEMLEGATEEEEECAM